MMPFACYFFIFINVGLGEGAKLNAATATLGRTGFIAIPVMIGGIEQSVIIQWGWNA
ncbi:phage tail protein, partial [Escherichia coli]|nr:phage tail protein [Escherichia coli]MDF6069862.1 phage tail protein [Escherichia coli]